MRKEEENALLVLKNGALRAIYLMAYIGMMLFSLMLVLLAGAGFLIGGGIPALYGVIMGIALLCLVLSGIITGLYFADNANGFTATRLKVIDGIKTLVRVFFIVAGITLVITGFMFREAKISGLQIGIGLTLTALELVFLLYGLWKIAWARENPGRYIALKPKEEEEIEEHKETEKLPSSKKAIAEKKGKKSAKEEPLLIEEKKKSKKK